MKLHGVMRLIVAGLLLLPSTAFGQTTDGQCVVIQPLHGKGSAMSRGARGSHAVDNFTTNCSDSV